MGSQHRVHHNHMSNLSRFLNMLILAVVSTCSEGNSTDELKRKLFLKFLELCTELYAYFSWQLTYDRITNEVKQPSYATLLLSFERVNMFCCLPKCLFLKDNKLCASSNKNKSELTMQTSKIMKKSSPGSPCLTISSPSSNCTGSRASATVSRSHLSRFSEENKIMSSYSSTNNYCSSKSF